MTVRLTPAARADLISLHRWIAKDRPSAADAMLRRLSETLEGLGEQPGMGRAKLPSRPDVLVFPTQGYVVFYRQEATDGVLVLRVLHGARDWQRLME
ncbi:MAG: type II toxin-antitoxin system RelE/ParE family toxin [Pseudomonadota bacterium]